MSKYKIFFLHGWLFDSRIWFGLDELLSNQHQSILIDLPGYGKNKEKKEKPVKYCREIFSGLSSPSVVVGWSYGGILALLGLPRYYQSIEKIILINSHPILVSKNRLANNINLDNIENLKVWLEKLGNPYARIGIDKTGITGIDWGVNGIPESFLIDQNGIIKHKINGVIDEKQIKILLIKIESLKK